MFMFIFLLFTVENGQRIDFSQTFGLTSSYSQSSNSTTHLAHTLSLKKSNPKHNTLGTDLIEESKTDDISIARDLVATMTFIGFTFFFLIKLLFLKRKKLFFVNTEKHNPSTKTFLLLETIRL